MPDSNTSIVGVRPTKAAAPSPNENRRLLAFVSDETSAAALRAGLVGAGRAANVKRGTVHEAIRFLAKEPAPHVLVVDIDGQANPQVVLDDLARVCPPHVKVIVVGEKADISFYRLIVHDLGAAEYVHKPLTRDTVQRLILPHLSGDQQSSPGLRGGHIVAVCGARGGVGATTVAVNMALEVARVTSGHVALLDLHLQGGCTAAMLSGKPGPGLRIALEDPEGIDELFLERAAITVTPRLRLIAAEEAFEAAPTISDTGATSLLERLCQKFNFIIVDLPMPLPPAMRGILAMARHVVVVLAPDVFSLRDTRSIRHLVASVTGGDRVLTVLNRLGMSGGLKPALIEKGLGGRPDFVIPELGNRMLEAANFGIPAVQRLPALRRHLAPLVREVAGVETGRARRSLLAKVIRR